MQEKEEERVKFGIETTIEEPQVAALCDTPTALRRRSNCVGIKTLLYLAMFLEKFEHLAKILKVDSYTGSMYMRIIFCNIQIILEYHSLE